MSLPRNTFAGIAPKHVSGVIAAQHSAFARPSPLSQPRRLTKSRALVLLPLGCSHRETCGYRIIFSFLLDKRNQLSTPKGRREMSTDDIRSNLTSDPTDKEPDYAVQLALLAAIVQSSDDAIVSKTLEGRIQSWNAGAERIFGYTVAEAVGQPITIIIPPELRDEEKSILERVGRGDRVDHFDTTRVTKDGRRISISLTVSPVRDSRGIIVGASKVARDISERKRAEETLRESERRLKVSEEALRDADRRKDELLALIGHELRNLLTPIRYSLAANKRGDRTPEQRKRSEEIMGRQVALMGRLLDDLLDVSRITEARSN